MRISPYPWPEGKKCAVLIAVLFDDGLDALFKAPDLINRRKSYSVWEYGAKRGVARLLSCLLDFSIKGTWFIPGHVIEKHRDLIKDIHCQGHEIAARGWNFELYDKLTEEETFAYLGRASKAISAICLYPPRGFSLPAGHWPIGFDRILHKAGFDWSASLNGDDCPYQHECGLVEIPIHRELEDRPYFQFNFTPPFPKGLSRLPSYEAVLKNWQTEFDAYRTYGLCFVLQIRPEMIATPGRIFILRELLQYIGRFDDVWLASGSMIADWHLAQSNKQKACDIKGHPMEVFASYRLENNCHD